MKIKWYYITGALAALTAILTICLMVIAYSPEDLFVGAVAALLCIVSTIGAVRDESKKEATDKKTKENKLEVV